VLQPSSSLVLRENIDRQGLLSLVELWLREQEENEAQLIVKDTLFNLAGIDNNLDTNKQLETEDFILLIGSKFNAFLTIENIVPCSKYQVAVAFNSEVIIQELIKLGDRQQWAVDVIKYLQTSLIDRLSHGCDDSINFVAKAVKLLIGRPDQTPFNYKFYPNPPMNKLLDYQVEQEQILDLIKIQISQNLDLAKIIQTGIDRGCKFLGLDRLLIYQLDVPASELDLSAKSTHTVDAVTYEAKENNVLSSLYFQEEGCWHQSPNCQNKYEQGFNLVINNLADCLELNPCLGTLIEKFQVKAKTVIPIIVKDKLWGLLIAHQCFSTRQWDYQDLQFLRHISEYIAIAIYQNQSYQQLQRQKILLEKQVKAQAKQIRDALIAAEAASKSKHDFLGSMSHELRTPLTCVIGLSSTLLQWSSDSARMQLSPEKQQKYLHLIQQNGKHLLSLINNILEFSDVESGKHLLNVEQISLSDIAKQSLQMVYETANAKDIVLSSEIKIRVEQEYFFADSLRLKEILFNLLSNGIKFTPEKGEVTLRVWREKRRVIFQIEDTGIGIAPEETPLLFEKFKQIEDFRQRVHGGTGLGLALTKKLVELHGGTIEVESGLGEGSIFTVNLPVKIPFQPDFHPKSPIVDPALANSQTIMLITEDEESAIFMCQLLNTLKYQVVWLMDSATAINQIELLQPKIIIIDPDCSPLATNELTNAIAKRSLINDITLMLMCDRIDEEQWQQFVRDGVDDYLTKSMNPVQIVNKINSLVKSKVVE